MVEGWIVEMLCGIDLELVVLLFEYFYEYWWLVGF